MFPGTLTRKDIEAMEQHKKWIKNKGWLKKNNQPEKIAEDIEINIETSEENTDSESNEEDFSKKKKKKR